MKNLSALSILPCCLPACPVKTPEVIPAAGRWIGKGIEYYGTTGNYWTSTLYKSNNGTAMDIGLYCIEGSVAGIGSGNSDRCNGYSIRPVRDKKL